MAYQVLARKWRPQLFEDVLGQQAVTRTLKNALKSKRIAQAFVFSGPRGCGKTTTARILARALSCVKGPTAEPCGVCDACVEIAEGRDIDVLEIDAATHTGVDNVRAFAGDTMAVEDVVTVLGLVGRDLVFDMLDAVATEDAPASFALVERAIERGYDLRLLCRELARATRDLLILSVDPRRASD